MFCEDLCRENAERSGYLTFKMNIRNMYTTVLFLVTLFTILGNFDSLSLFAFFFYFLKLARNVASRNYCQYVLCLQAFLLTFRNYCQYVLYLQAFFANFSKLLPVCSLSSGLFANFSKFLPVCSLSSGLVANLPILQEIPPKFSIQYPLYIFVSHTKFEVNSMKVNSVKDEVITIFCIVKFELH